MFQTNSLIPDGYRLKIGDMEIVPESSEGFFELSPCGPHGNVINVSPEFVEALITKGFEVEEDPYSIEYLNEEDSD